MTPSPVCPDRSRLEQFLLGQLSEIEAEPVERHLLTCASCLRALRALQPNDSLVEAVRANWTRDADSDLPLGEVDQLVRKIKDACGGVHPVPRAANAARPATTPPEGVAPRPVEESFALASPLFTQDEGLSQQPPAEGPATRAGAVSGAGPLGVADLVALIPADQERHWRRGQRLLVEDYLHRFPVLRADRDALLTLISGELILRAERDEEPGLEEYLQRFPDQVVALRRRFSLHQALKDASLLDVDLNAPNPVRADLVLEETNLLVPAESPARPNRPGERQEFLTEAKTTEQGSPSTTPSTIWHGIPAAHPLPPSPPPPTTKVQWQDDNRETATFRPPAQAQPPRDRTGARQVSGYEIQEELGRGGMGVVYKAWQVHLKRTVALKMILEGAHAAHEDLLRFRSEAEAVARLQHPNIVQIYEIGEHDGLPFFSLEYVDGGTLGKRMAGTPLADTEAAQLLETLARAMHVAHQAGIIHRDLKPANVLLTTTGTPKITDFGLAKQLREESIHSHTAIMGTPPYMAPEQAMGSARDIGPRTDVYALGALLYEMLTGRPPFRGPTVLDTLEQVRSQEPVPPRRLQPKVARDLETICLKCLEKDPGRRYASAADLAADLHGFRNHEPIQARRVGPWERAVKWAHRRPAVALLTLVSGVAILGLLTGGLFYARYENQLLTEVFERQKQASALMRQGRQFMELNDLDKAAVSLANAADRVGLEPSLASLAQEIDGLKEDVEARLADREMLRKDLARCELLDRKHDDALFYSTLSISGDGVLANVTACRAAAEQALALFGVTAESDTLLPLHASLADRQVTVTAACYELLLILAEAVATPLPGQPVGEQRAHAREALHLLDRAARFNLATQAYYLRRFRYLQMLQDNAAAQQARQEAATHKPSTALDYYLVGDEHYKQGEIEQALTAFDSSLALAPNHFWARYFLSVCNLRLGRFADARASLTVCLNQRTDLVWTYLMRAFANGQLSEPQAAEKAEEDFEKALAILKSKPSADASYVLYANRGIFRVRQRRYPDAIADLKRAIALKPRQYQAYATLAQVYREQALGDQVRVEAVAGLLPGVDRWLLEPLLACQRLRLLEAAAGELNQAIALEPELAVLYRNRGWLDLERQDFPRALRDFEQAVLWEANGPATRETARGHVQYGRVLQRLERHQDALAAFDQALKLDPEYASAHLGRAEALLRLRAYADAVRAFDRYFATGGRLQAEVYRARGLAQLQLSEHGPAIRDLTRALELKPEDSSVYAARGWAYLSSNAPQLALPDFEAALVLAPDNSDAYNGRGYARVKLGRYQAGIVDGQEALRRGPLTPLALWKTARIFAQAVTQEDAAMEASPQLRSVGNWERRRSWQNRAVQLLQQALAGCQSAEERSAFWEERILPDQALLSVRRTTGFFQLEDQLSRAAHRPTDKKDLRGLPEMPQP